MGQQQLGEVSVRELVPMYPVYVPVPLRVAEVEMQIQHIQIVVLRLDIAVEVGLDHLFNSGRGNGRLLFREEAPSDLPAQGHGRVPHQEARLWQHLAQVPEQVLQVRPVAAKPVRPIPGDVPETGVHDDQVRGVLVGLQLFQHGPDILTVHACEEVEAHQVVAGAELADLAVVSAVAHDILLASFHQLVLFEAQLPLDLELVVSEQAILLQQEHQVLVHGPLDGVSQDDDELVVEQLLHFGGLQLGHDVQVPRPSSFLCTRVGLQRARTEGESSWEEPTLGRPSGWARNEVLAWETRRVELHHLKAGSGEREPEGSLEPEALLGLAEAWDLTSELPVAV